MIRFALIVVLVSLVLLGALALHTNSESATEDVGKAIASMRRIDPDRLSDEQKKAKGLELVEAWKVLVNAGASGAAALKEEIERIDNQKERDDHFKLGAAAILWKIGKADEAKTIANIWSGNVDLTVNSQYVFFTAFDAACTQDLRVLPMLTAILGDRKGRVFIPMHSMTIEWPLFQEFIWGAFGSKGLPTLERILYDSREDKTLASVGHLLAAAGHEKVLDRIREIAGKSTGTARDTAIRALGLFGHPEDFEFLVRGLKNGQETDKLAFAFALYEYGDLRAVTHLIPLLSTKNGMLGKEIVAVLMHLITPEGIEALERCAEKAGVGEQQDYCRKAVLALLKSMGLTSTSYNAKTPLEKTKLAAIPRGQAANKYRMKTSDRKLTHDDLLKAAAEWVKNKSIKGGTYAWVEDRHVMSAATARDIPLLLDVAAACYARLSDECLYEVRILRQLINRLSRSRYRKDAGVCPRVEPL
jgi:hypothetical protein